MRLKEGMILHTVAGEHMMVPTGDAAKDFNGLVRGNDTARFILEMLLTDTTEEAIVEAMAREYNAPREILARDVHRILDQLEREGLLE